MSLFISFECTYNTSFALKKLGLGVPGQQELKLEAQRNLA